VGSLTELKSVERSTNVDVLRAFAALGVLFGHAYILSGKYPAATLHHPLQFLVVQGGVGVWLFFALSGYLIAGPFVRALVTGDPLPGLKAYAYRRVGRIYPLYLLAFVVIAFWGLEPGIHPTWWQYPLHAALLQNLVPGQEQALLFTAWTLSVEVIFYLAVPAVASVIRRLHKGPIRVRHFGLGIASLWLLSIMWTALADKLPSVEYSLWLRIVFPGVFAMFCPGILVSLAVTSWHAAGRPPRPLEWVMAHRAATLVGAAVLALSGAMLATRHSLLIYDAGRMFFALASGLVVSIAVVSAEIPGRVGRILAELGLISYGIYLWQGVIFGVLDRHPTWGIIPLHHAGTAAYVVHAMFLLALIIPVSWLSWTLIERPVLGWFKRRGGSLTVETKTEMLAGADSS